MLNILWPIFILISVFYAGITGNMEKVNDSIFESSASAVKLTITFLSTICLWTGLMKIAQETEITRILVKILRPVINLLFKDIKEDEKAKEEISMNMVANMLGLGNAATPLGIKAMKTLQKKNINKDTISPSIAMFIVINTASIQIIPTTAIAIRNSLNSQNGTKIIFPVWIATISAAIVAISATKIFIKASKGKK